MTIILDSTFIIRKVKPLLKVKRVQYLTTALDFLEYHPQVFNSPQIAIVSRYVIVTEDTNYVGHLQRVCIYTAEFNMCVLVMVSRL